MNWKKIKAFFKRNKEGAIWGLGVGLFAFIMYQATGGDFGFAINEVQRQISLNPAGRSFSLEDITSMAIFSTAISWMILGSIIGIIIDNYYKPKR